MALSDNWLLLPEGQGLLVLRAELYKVDLPTENSKQLLNKEFFLLFGFMGMGFPTLCVS